MRRSIEARPGGRLLLRTYRGMRRVASRFTLGHRRYVGGLWEEIGRVQFDFMVRQGLEAQNVLVDVGCGSLRGGRFFIEYLDPERYLGIDRNEWLIEAGLKHEVPPALKERKRPQFVVSDRFEFQKFGKSFDYGIAQSLFSHLTKEDIHLCLMNLRPEMRPQGRFYATFMARTYPFREYVNPRRSDERQPFRYDAEEILAIGREAGWQGRYVGDWGHPRGQLMLEFIA